MPNEYFIVTFQKQSKLLSALKFVFISTQVLWEIK